ncbi:MAG TPA: proteasome accessory factor PafA2 family protein, partial [Planctomycetaceae bacterium]|nr:proteasome accessory factor PafA2 family protein [Planctomycetaceae bacterium]
VRWAAFRDVWRLLPAFLVSRAVIAGAGRIDRAGRFHIANKAAGINCVLGYGGLFGDRPMFSIGHFFKLVLYRVWQSPRDLLDLFACRQRLQVCIGDSNMSEEAEYLRVGTTMLVLDALEAGALADAPRIRRPIRALHRLAADPSLQAGQVVRLSGRAGQSAGLPPCRPTLTALELQHFYLDRCRRFVETIDDPNIEAREILERWAEVLDALEHDRRSLVGRVDWVTKQLLLEQAGRDAGWAALKKIDIRYHELTPGGYFARLRPTGLASVIVPAKDLERAARTPPPDTPATMRGHYIREFSEGSRGLKVSWNSIVLGSGLSRKIVRLTRFRRRPA